MATHQPNRETEESAESEILAFDPNRKVRDVSGAIGQSFPVKALRKVGLADDDGNLVPDDLYAPQKIRRVGDVVKVETEIPLDALDDQREN